MNSRLLILGDSILDRWIEGDCRRFSPEAAIPVHTPSGVRHQSPGGAAAVAWMAAALGAEVHLASLIPYGRRGNELRQLLQEAEVNLDLTAATHRRHLTVKTRYLTPSGPVLRVDEETTAPWEDLEAQHWRNQLLEALPSFDYVLLADYDKGTLSPTTLRALLERHRRVIVDPARGRDWRHYEGAWGLKCNEVERQDQKTIGVDWSITTLGERGMLLQQIAPHSALELPAKRRAVRDVTGCGDQVMATLGVWLAEGRPLPDACRAANAAGGLQAERPRLQPVTREELLEELRDGRKVLWWEEARAVASRLRAAGKKLVFTNGCFDLLHPGHLQTLQFAAAQGDCLLVGLNSDASVEALKGPSRPIQSVELRAEVLAALECVHYVVPFIGRDPRSLIQQLRPDLLVKGADAAPIDNIPGAKEVLERGGRVLLAPWREGYSTTRLIESLQTAV